MAPPLSALVAMSSFKGVLSNSEACLAVGEGLKKLEIQSEVFPIADGGRYSLEAVQRALPHELVMTECVGPLGEATKARILCLPDASAPEALYIESADTCGYHLVPNEGRDAMRATSQGLGKTISFGLKKWGKTLSTIYIGLGDSAISDMGMGMLSALDFRFVDRSGQPLWGNANSLRQIHDVILPDPGAFDKVKFVVLCDVLNPLLGAQGSARTFAKQKGASSTQISLIEQGMEHFSKRIQEINGRALREEPMTGAAGGLGAAFLAFFNTQLVLGARFLLDWLHFEEHLSPHRFVVTGEGKTDSQTANGKSPEVCLERAERFGKKAVIISGVLGEGYTALLHHPNLKGCFECGNIPSPKEALYQKTLEVFSQKDLVKSLK